MSESQETTTATKRKRAITDEEGTYQASVQLLRVQSKRSTFAKLEHFVQLVNESVSSSKGKDFRIKVEMIAKKAMHCSLSTTQRIKSEDRFVMYCALKKKLRESLSRRGKKKDLDDDLGRMRLERFRVFANDEKTTTFVCLCERECESRESASEYVREIVKEVNECVAEFGFAKYEYEPTLIPHVSVAYAVGDYVEEIKRAIDLVINDDRRKDLVEDVVVECRTDTVDLMISGWEPKCVYSSEKVPPPEL